MAAVVCLLLLLSCSIAGQATHRSSLATGWQNDQVSEKAESTAWKCNDCSKAPSAIHGTTAPDEKLAKRTNSSPPSHHHFVRLQPVPTTHTPTGAPPARHVLAADHFRLPGMSTATPSQGPAVGPSADHTVATSSGKRPYNEVAKTLAVRDKNARRRLKNENLKPTAKMNLGRLKYATATDEEIRAINNGRHRRWMSTLTPEQKADLRRRRAESSKRSKERQKARRRGNNSPAPPLQRKSRNTQHPEQDQERAKEQEVRQHAPADARSEEAAQRSAHNSHAPSDFHDPPTTLRLGTPGVVSGSWPLLESLPRDPLQGFASGRSSPPVHSRVSLSAQGSFTSGQKQTRAPRQAAPPNARTMEEERLRLILAPPGQHEPPDEHDWLQLTLATPGHD